MQETTRVERFGDDSMSMAGRAMTTALGQGRAVVCICVDAKRRLLEEQLAVLGVDLTAASATGRYASLDALDALSSIVVDGAPDVIRFAEVIGALIDRAAEQHGGVSIFAELVPLTRTEYDHTGAIELETLCRSFIASRPILRDCR